MRYLVLLSIFVLSFQDTTFVVNAPTSIKHSLMRGGPGAYGSSRGEGKKHAGVDIVANQSSVDKSIYAVYAVNSGKVAYAKINGTATSGYGYTVIIDHEDGNYSQYSHLATKASTGVVKLGTKVTVGQIIGYIADLANGEKSSGNVLAEVVKPYDKIQLHFECFSNQAGLSSTTSLEIFHKGGTLLDPTKQLKALKYSSF